MRHARGFIDGEYQDGEVRGLGFLAGERGMGKTTKMLMLAGQCKGPQIFFDTVGTHRRLLHGWTEVNQPGELEEFLRDSLGDPVRVVYVPRDEFPEQHMMRAALMVRVFGTQLARRYGDREGIIFHVDEIDNFCGAEWGNKGMPKALYDLAHFGRHYHVSMLCTARDPATLSIKFRSQCASMRVFRVSEERYVKYFEARIGKLNAAKLPTLQKTYFLHWRAGDINAQIEGGPRAGILSGGTGRALQQETCERGSSVVMKN